MNKFLKNQKGFSLVQAMVAAGVAGIVGMATMGVMQQSSKVMKTAERSSTINQLYGQAQIALTNGSACDATLGAHVGNDFAVGHAPQAVGPIFNMVPDPAGVLVATPVISPAEVFDGVIYGGATFQRTGPSELTFVLNFEKEEQNIVGGVERRNTYGGRVRSRSIRVAATFTGDTLDECNGVDTTIGEEVKDEFCTESMGGFWDNSVDPGVCRSISVTQNGGDPAITSDGPLAVNGPANVAGQLDVGGPSNLGGPTNVTGALDVAGSIETDGSLCKNGNCVDPGSANCPAGTYMNGYNPNGTKNCQSVQAAVTQALDAIFAGCAGANKYLVKTAGGYGCETIAAGPPTPPGPPSPPGPPATTTTTTMPPPPPVTTTTTMPAPPMPTTTTTTTMPAPPSGKCVGDWPNWVNPSKFETCDLTAPKPPCSSLAHIGNKQCTPSGYITCIKYSCGGFINKTTCEAKLSCTWQP